MVIGAGYATGYVPAIIGVRTATAESTRSLRRLEAIHHAQVWKTTNVRSMNLLAGPEGPVAFKPNETVSCDFIQSG